MTFDATNRICKSMFEMLNNPRGNTMSDRWGSETCSECCNTKSRLEFATCGLCFKTMCKECLEGYHKCETPEAEDEQINT